MDVGEEERVGCMESVTRELTDRVQTRQPKRISPQDSAQTRAGKQPRGAGWGGRREGAQASGTPRGTLWLLHAGVWYKPMQLCNAIILPN